MPRLPRLAALSFLAFVALATGALAAPPPAYVPDEVLVRYRPAARAAEQAALRAAVHGRVLRDFGFIRVERLRLDGVSVADAVARLSADPRVEFAEPNYELRADRAPNDPLYPREWHLHNTGQTGGTPGADIRAPGAWDQFTGDSTLLVGDIDSGLDYHHPDLVANVWTNPGEIPDNGIDDDGDGYVDDVHGYDFANNDSDPMDDNGHGTHTAGIIAARGDNGTGVSGVCWRAKIVAIKFLNAAGVGSVASAVEAIQYSIRVGCRITNNSWGGAGDSQALRSAVAAAGAAGQLFVAACGNASRDVDVDPNYPSGYRLPNVISVAATDADDQLAIYSNFGATTVDLAAPGSDILSTFPADHYALLSGTSMATPMVTGVAALAMGRFPQLDAPAIRDLVLRSVVPLPQLAGRVATGGRLDAFLTLLVPDSLPPAAISDLTASDVSSNGVTLTWTATGDDSLSGRATRVEVRVASGPITPATWAAATLVPGTPEPDAAGTPERFDVSGLAFQTSYWIAARAFDEVGNASALSNQVAITTLGIPRVQVAPDSLAATLVSGRDTVETLTLTNAGAGTLDFTIPSPQIAIGTSHAFAPVAFAKGVDDAAGQPVAEAHGGPDGFGYRWADSDEAGGPGFAWIDAKALGQPLALSGDDALSASVDIGFDFPFYGQTFRGLRVCTNGFLTVTDVQPLYGNQPLPNPAAPSGLIAPFWDDLDLGVATHVYAWGDGSRFVVEYLDAPRFQTGGSFTFEVILEANGTVRYQYLRMSGVLTSATIGLQSPDFQNGLDVAFNAPYVHDSLAVKLAQIPQWLSVAPSSGRVRAGESLPLAVHLASATLEGGRYDAHVAVVSNDPADTVHAVPVGMRVLGLPRLAATPPAVDFGDVFVGASALRVITLSNPGTDTLHVASVRASDGAVAVDGAGFVLPRFAHRDVALRFTPSAPGPLAATLDVASDDPLAPLAHFALAGLARPAPVLSIAPESLAVDLAAPDSARLTLRLTNTGGSPLAFHAATARVSVPAPFVAGDAQNVPIAKGAADVLHGVTPFAAGGPDGAGYTWRDSREPDAAPFQWEEIIDRGTPIALAGDDAVSAPIPIGFAFPFYGSTFDSLRVSTNGLASFTSASAGFSNTTLPNQGSGVPENLLAVFWDDLVFQGGARAAWWRENGRFIVEYRDVTRFGEPASPNTFEFVLSADGTIEYRWLALRAVSLSSATVGIQNGARDDGLQVVFNAPFLADSLALRIDPPLGWLAVSPDSGVVAPGDGADVAVRVDSRGLRAGPYRGAVRIVSNDPIEGVRQAPVALHVRSAAALDVSPGALAFGRVSIGEPARLDVALANTSADTLHVSKLAGTDAHLRCDFTRLTLVPYETRHVDVLWTPDSEGPFAAEFVIASDDATHPEQRLPVTGEARSAPVAVLQPAALDVPLAHGPAAGMSSATRLVRIVNAGGNDLVWRAAARLGVGAEGPVPADPEGAKGAVGLPGALGTGGPDAGGYRWIDSDEPGGPLFDWIDVRSVGTRLALDGDDQVSAPVALTFPFAFYGATFDSLRVCTNGYASFTSTIASYGNVPLPNAGPAVPENLLAAFWDDQDFRPTSGAAAAYVWGDSQRFVIAFHDVPHVDLGGPYTYEIVLGRDGSIEYRYLHMPSRTNEATIGIQNAARDAGLQVVCNAGYVHDALTVRLAREAPWLAVTPDSGRVAAGAADTLRVTLSADALPDGDTSGEIRVATNDLTHAEVRVPVRAHVGLLAAEARFAPRSLGAVHVDHDVRLALRVPGHDASELVAASILLNGAIAPDREFAPRIDGGRLVVGFAQPDLLAARPGGGTLPFVVTGQVANAGWFVGADTLRVPQATLREPATLAAWGARQAAPAFEAQTAHTFAWTDPADAQIDHYELWWSRDGGDSWDAIATALRTPVASWTPPADTSRAALVEMTGWHGGDVTSAWLSQPFLLVRPDLGSPPAPPRVFGVRLAGSNPVRGDVAFDVALPAAARVTLDVFDVNGARVTRLVDGAWPAGVHRVAWDGRDAGRRPLPAGLYFARATAGRERAVARVVLLR